MDDDLADAPRSSRRDAIVNATLDVIVRGGVAAATYRVVAAEAHVSLGAVSHHFSDKDDLHAAALTVFTEQSAASFGAYFATVDSLESLREACTTMLLDTAADPREIALGCELYGLALRSDRYRRIAAAWTSACRAHLESHLDAPSTFALDAFYEGLVLHRGMGLGAYSDELVRLSVERLIPAAAYRGA